MVKTVGTPEEQLDLQCLVAASLRGKQTPSKVVACARSARRYEPIREALANLPGDLREEHSEKIISATQAVLRKRLPSVRSELAETLGITSTQARVLMSVLAGMTVAKAVNEVNASGEQIAHSTGTRWMTTAAERIAAWIADRDTRPVALDDYLQCHETRCAYIDPRGMRRTTRSQDLVLPLTDVYISVQLGPESAAEVAADLDLTTSDMGTEPLRDRLLDDLLAFEEHEAGQSEHFARVIQDRRWIVVLGDPGAGKTTLLNWLALKNAQAIRKGQDRVVVDGRRLGLPDSEQVDLGPARLPVLMRVADYADELKRVQATGQQQLPSIYNYLGCHNVGDEPLPGNADDHIRLIRRYLAAGEALVLVDGLDEITDVHLRQHIADKLDSFAREHVPDPVEPGAYTPLADEGGWWAVTPSKPAAAGGNQLVVTCRVAGFKEARLKGGFAIMKIAPLSEEAIRRFADDWCLAVERFRARSASAPQEEIESRAAQSARALAEGIFGEPRIRRLATNPLLLTVLAMLQRERGRMPTRRVDLYEEATRVLVERRQTQEWSFEEVIDILGPFALWVQENSNTGHAGENDLRQQIRIGLRRATEEVVEAYVEGFVRSAREQTGLLVEVGVGRYGFLHGTFREYLAAKEVTRSQERFESVVRRFLHAPRWVEVLLLGVAIISKDRPDDADDAVELILDQSSPLEDLLHRNLAFAAACLHEMVRVTPALAGSIISRLFQAAAWAQHNKFERLRLQLVDMLAELSTSRPRAVTPRLLEALQSEDTAGVAIAVAQRHHQATVELLDALYEACQSARRDPAAATVMEEVALSLFQEGALTDSAFEPIRTLLERYEQPFAELTERSPAIADLIHKSDQWVNPALREAYQWLFERILRQRDGDGVSLEATLVAELLVRAAQAHGNEMLVLWSEARVLLRAEADKWMLISYASGWLHLESAARCMANVPLVLPTGESDLKQWFDTLTEPARLALLEYQSFTAWASPLVPVAWSYAAEDGTIGSAAQTLLCHQALTGGSLPASSTAFEALRKMLLKEAVKTLSTARALLPRLRTSPRITAADLHRIAADINKDLCAQQAAILLCQHGERLSPEEYDLLGAAVADPSGVLRDGAIASLIRQPRMARSVDDSAVKRSWHHQAERRSAGDGAGASAHGQFTLSIDHDDVSRLVGLANSATPDDDIGGLAGAAVNDLLRQAEQLPPDICVRVLGSCLRSALEGKPSGADLALLAQLCCDLPTEPRMQAVQLLGTEAVLTRSWAQAGHTVDRLLALGDLGAATALVHAGVWRLPIGGNPPDFLLAGIVAARDALKRHVMSADEARDFAAAALLVECATTVSDHEADPTDWVPGVKEAAAAVIGALTTDHPWTHPAQPNTLQWRLARFATRLAAHVRGMHAILDEVVSALEDEESSWMRRRAALFVMDAAATASPAQFLRAASLSSLRELVLIIADDANSFSARLLSIRVLSHFRRLDSQTVSAIARACHDAETVTSSVLQRCQSISIEHEPSIAEIVALLDSQHPPTVIAAALLLTTLARSPDTSAIQRRAAEEALALAIRSENPIADVMGGRDGRSLRSLLHDLLTNLAQRGEPLDVAQLIGAAMARFATTSQLATTSPAPPPPPGPADLPASASLAETVRRTPRTAGSSPKSHRPLRLKKGGGSATWVELGLGDVDGHQLAHLERAMYSALQIRVGTALARKFTGAQISEFEVLRKDKGEEGLLAWLELNAPNYREIVREYRTALFEELSDKLPDILGALREVFEGS